MSPGWPHELFHPLSCLVGFHSPFKAHAVVATAQHSCFSFWAQGGISLLDPMCFGGAMGTVPANDV